MPTQFTNLLDVAIVLAALYIALSTFSSFLIEQIATFLKLRGSKLFLGVANLVSTKTLANAIFDHPAINTTVNSQGGIQSRPSAPNRPSYVDPHNFAIAFWDELANEVTSTVPAAVRAKNALTAAGPVVGGMPTPRQKAAAELSAARAAATTVGGTGVLTDAAHFEDLRQVVESLPQGELRTKALSLLALAGNDYGALLTATESWFNRQMDAVQGWYTRQQRYLAIPFAVFVVFLTGVDTFEIAQRLYTAPAKVSTAASAVINAFGNPADTREQSVANAASSVLNGNDFRQYFHPCLGLQWQICGVTADSKKNADKNRERDENEANNAKIADDVAKARVAVDTKALAQAQNDLAAANGNPDGILAAAKKDDIDTKVKQLATDATAAQLSAANLVTVQQAVEADAPFSAHVFGWIVTIVAISLGAPFWFDVANKIVNVRNAGGKPPTASGK